MKNMKSNVDDDGVSALAILACTFSVYAVLPAEACAHQVSTGSIKNATEAKASPTATFRIIIADTCSCGRRHATLALIGLVIAAVAVASEFCAALRFWSSHA